VSADAEVTIAGRVFTLGTVYAHRPRMYGHRPRRLLRYDPDSPLPGGKVEIAVVPSGGERVVAGAVWAAGGTAPASAPCRTRPRSRTLRCGRSRSTGSGWEAS